MTIHDETNLPHGGVKKSGFGRFNGLSGAQGVGEDQGCSVERLGIEEVSGWNVENDL